MSSLRRVGLIPYSGKLDSVSAATGMQAARLNALDLLHSSKLLFQANQFRHSIAFAVLAIEEAAKIPIIQSIFLEAGDSREKWKGLRQHTYKGKFLNPAITSLATATFPDLDEETIIKVSQGPAPDDLDAAKQLSLYSECFETTDGPIWHLPKNLSDSDQAKHWLAEAQAMVLGLRNYPPDELEVWYRHARQYDQLNGEQIKVMMQELKNELLAKGFIKEGWWDPIMKEMGKDLP